MSDPFGRTTGLTTLFIRLLRGPVLISLGGIAALALGYIGYRQLPGDLSTTDALYDALQLFVLDSSAPPGATPWQLEIARFLAPAVIGYAALVTILTLAREQAQRVRARLISKGHLVVIGLGDRGSALARRARRAGRDVVAIEADASNGAIAGLRAGGVAVLTGDARDPEILRFASTGVAADVVTLTGDDSLNLEILAALNTVDEGTPEPTPIHVVISDPVLWKELHRLRFDRGRSPRRVEFLSLPDRIAIELVDAVGGLERTGSWRSVALCGSGPTLDRALVHAVRRGFLDTNQSTVTFTGNAADRLGELTLHEPWLLDVVAVGGDAEIAEPTLGFVAGLPEGSALSAAATLRTKLPQGSEIVAAVPDEAICRALDRTDFDLDRITLVPAEERVLSTKLVQRSATEILAEAKHEDYVRQLSERGETQASNPSLVPWDRLPESLKDSNRRFADSIGAKLADLGALLKPLGASASPPALSADDAIIEHMAIEEHDRWVVDLRSDGWTPAPGEVKDPQRKRHPLMVPWDSLNEAEREKDRDAIRAIPGALAKLGYAVELPLRDRTP